MKLYYSPGACSLSPHIVLRESGLPFELAKVDLKSKAVEGGGDFRKVNPLGYVPALEINEGLVLTEGPAIVQYIADQVPETTLAPANGTLARTKLQSWLNFVSTELHKAFSLLSNAEMPETAKKLTRERIASRLAHLEEQLSASDYLLGQDFTCADAYCYTVLRWTRPHKMDVAPYPNVQVYMQRIEARPAVQDALRTEGLKK